MLEIFMKLAPIYIFIVILTLIVFVYFYFGSKRKISIENEKKPIFQKQCGGTFGRYGVFQWPYVRHALYREFVLIGFGAKKLILKYEEIKSVTSRRNIFSKSIIYAHKRSDLPRIISVRSFSSKKVVEILRDKGVEVN